MINRCSVRAAICALALAGPAAAAVTLDFPQGAAETGARIERLASYRMPVGPFAKDGVLSQVVEGALDQRAWRFDAPGRSTLDLLQPLRDQLTGAGFAILFECEAVQCGGFDFRYATDVLPEPEMHVDLGDFRYLAAARNTAAGPEHVSLIVSRAVDQGFAQVGQVGQVTQVGHFGQFGQKPSAAAPQPASQGAGAAITATGAGQATAGVPERTVDPAAAIAAPATGPVDDGGGLIRGLLTGGAQVLDDLQFASGSAALSDGDYASLAELGAFLRDSPKARVMLVGHTDRSGDLAANIALSRERARSVRQRLLSRFDIPPRQIEAEGAGYLVPRAPNETEAGRLANRRVEVMLLANGFD